MNESWMSDDRILSSLFGWHIVSTVAVEMSSYRRKSDETIWFRDGTCLIDSSFKEFIIREDHTTMWLAAITHLKADQSGSWLGNVTKHYSQILSWSHWQTFHAKFNSNVTSSFQSNSFYVVIRYEGLAYSSVVMLQAAHYQTWVEVSLLQ